MKLLRRLFGNLVHPTEPLALKLEPGEHVYILLFNRNETSRSMMEQLCGSLSTRGIKAYALESYDPITSMAYLKLENTNDLTS